MIVASIDIGTNTVLLLIADVNPDSSSIKTVKNVIRMPRIGQGTITNGIIVAEKIELLLSVLSEFAEIIQDYECELVILTGTNAFRIADNTPAIAELIKQKFNFDINVISGEEEAEMAFLGASSELKNIKNTVVIDIGGSSTEIIHGNANKILSKISLEIGSVAATENFLKHSPPLLSEIINLEIESDKLVSGIDLIERPDKVIAVAGTATTAACMILGLQEFQERTVNGFEIEQKMMDKLIANLLKLNTTGILQKYGNVLAGREDIILAGLIIFNRIMKNLGFEKVTVSTRGIRYGAIVKHFRK